MRAQRRQRDGHDAQAIVEVLAELALLDLGAQVLAGRRDDALREALEWALPWAEQGIENCAMPVDANAHSKEELKQVVADIQAAGLDVTEEGDIEDIHAGKTSMNFSIASAKTDFVIITFVFDDKFYVSEKVFKKQ